MRRIENECVCCENVGRHCIGSGCHKRRVVRHYCDNCESEEQLYQFYDQELCGDCLKDMSINEGSLEKVKD